MHSMTRMKMTGKPVNDITGLFGFAKEDYMDKYSYYDKDIVGKEIFGGVIEETDSYVSITSIISLCVSAGISMIIFDISDAHANQIYHVRDTFRSCPDYEEISGMFDSSIAFARE